MRIIPMPKRLYEDAGRICVGGELRVCCPDGMMPRLEVLLGLMLHGVKVSFTSASEANIVLCSDCPDPRAEYYEIKVGGDSAVLSFSDFLGARNAVATLSQLISVENGEIYLPKLKIEDWPDAEFRSFMHDVGRSYVKRRIGAHNNHPSVFRKTAKKTLPHH